MKSITEMRRKHTKWSIEQNPTEITIHRTEKKRMGGYIDEIETDVGPFVVRIFQNNSSSPQTITTLAGEKQISTQFGLLADHQANIQAGTNVKDEFEAHGMKFLVKSIVPQIVQGEVVGYQGELERVN